MATKTAVIVLCGETILICSIPPLSPHPPDFFDHNPTHHIPPLFTIPLPDDMLLHGNHFVWNTISSWYFGSSQPLYFDTLCEDSKLHRFQIMLKPDLSTASLHVIKASELTALDFNYVSFQSYRICEDTLVSCFVEINRGGHHGVYTGITSTRSANVISHDGLPHQMSFPYIGHGHSIFLCPASGRFAYLARDGSNTINVFNFF